MIVRETWIPRPKRQFHYKDIVASGYGEHCQLAAYLDYLKYYGAIIDFEYVFYDERFSIIYKEKTYYFIPQFIVYRTENILEYQAYSNPNAWYLKMWQLFRKQRPAIARQCRVFSELEYRQLIFELWDKDEREFWFQHITKGI